MAEWTLTVRVRFDDDNDPRERHAAEALAELALRAQTAFERVEPGRVVDIECFSDCPDEPDETVEGVAREVEMDVFGMTTFKVKPRSDREGT